MFLYVDGPTKVTFELPHDCLSRYLKECVEKHYWKSLEVFLLGGGGHGSYAKGEGGIATGNCDLKEISLCDVIKSNPKPNMYYELTSVFIDHGALVNGRNEQDIPLALAVNCDDHDLAVVLLKKNANPQDLLRSESGKPDDTPVHTAFRIGLSLGMLYVSESQSTVMLRALCKCLHIRGAKNSVVFENSHTLKMIYISFIISKKV
jgi:hypothetical protein